MMKFTFSFYTEILSAIKENFIQFSFSDAQTAFNLAHSKPVIFLRHDIDLDLDKALRMANIEFENKIKSCYMIMTNCPFYSLKEKKNRSLITELVNMGHEIGLHFDSHQSLDGASNIEINSDIERMIDNECQILEEITNQKINSISFHRPLKQFLYGSLFVSGRINAYSSELMTWYLSDSKGIWREGNPLPMLETPKKPFLQLLVHPIWWDELHESSNERLESFFETKTKNFTEDEKNKFDEHLANHLTIYRSKKQPL